MKEKDKELLSQLEDKNFYGALDYIISKGNIEALDSVLKEPWKNETFRKAISNNLLVNVLEKSPTSEFIKHIMENYVSDFSYKSLEGEKFHFILANNKNVPDPIEDWKNELPKTIVDLIEKNVAKTEIFEAYNRLISYKDLVHIDFRDEDLDLAKRLLKDFL